MHQKLDLANPLNRRRRATAGIDSAPPRRQGTPATGCIVKLVVGQAHGFIRLQDRREIYFHRGDLSEGTQFNSFKVGDVVAFELLEDRFSGARALQVTRRA
jgi:cold shock CspA family protein